MRDMHLPKSLDIEACLFSGQAFRWRPYEDGFIGAVENNGAIIKNAENGYLLQWEGPGDEAFWQHYFDMNRDYEEIAARYGDNFHVKNAFESCKGLHVLNQPLWETVCAFIISANNNDKRIRLIMQRIGESMGDAIEIWGETVYSFPSAKKMADAGAEKLRELGTGYRAEYLADTAGRIAQGYDLSLLPHMGYEKALSELITFKGIGEKVADCVLLFGCGYSQAFPVDVWVERVMQRLYGMEGNRRQIKQRSMELFGDHGGIVQQMLFHSARKGGLPL